MAVAPFELPPDDSAGASTLEAQKITEHSRQALLSQPVPFPSATGLYGEPIGKGAKAQIKILRYLATLPHPEVADRKTIAAGAPCDLPYCTSYIGSADPSIRTKNDSRIFPSLISRGLVEGVVMSGAGRQPIGYRLTPLGRAVTCALPLLSTQSSSDVCTSSKDPATPPVPIRVAEVESGSEPRAKQSQSVPFPTATGLYGEPIGKGSTPQIRILRYLATIAPSQVADRKAIAAGAPCDLPGCTEWLGSEDPSIRTKNDSEWYPSLISRGLVESMMISVAGQTRTGYRLTPLGRAVVNALSMMSTQSSSEVSPAFRNPAVAPPVPIRVANAESSGELRAGAVIGDTDLDGRQLGINGSLKHDKATVPAWVDRLLASPLFAEQKRRSGRGVPSDDTLAQLLAALDERGGKLTRVALARRLEFPAIRLPGLLAKAERLLNVEGYDVLRRDGGSETIELNRELLLKQFDLVE